MNDINNYGDLKRAIQIWLNRKDDATLNNIPMFANFALKQFTRMMKLPYYEAYIRLKVVEDYPFVIIPNNFLSAKSVTVNDKPYNRVDVETFSRLKEKMGTIGSYTEETSAEMSIPEVSRLGKGGGFTTCTQFVFTRISDQLHFIPELSPDDEVKMIYHTDIPEFRNDADQPYVLLIASDVMLYLSLKHAAIFLRDRDQASYWDGLAQEAVATLTSQLEEAEWSGSSLVVNNFDY